VNDQGFDYATFCQQIRDNAPTARYATMGADAFALYHRTCSSPPLPLRDTPVVAIYSRDMEPNDIWVFDAQWNRVRELSVTPA